MSIRNGAIIKNVGDLRRFIDGMSDDVLFFDQSGPVPITMIRGTVAKSNRNAGNSIEEFEVIWHDSPF